MAAFDVGEQIQYVLREMERGYPEAEFEVDDGCTTVEITLPKTDTTGTGR